MRQPTELETFDLTVFQVWLLSKASTEGGLYGYEAAKATDHIGRAGVYRAISRIAEKGYIQAETVPSADGPDREVYHLTDEGRLLFAESILKMAEVISAAIPVSIVIDGSGHSNFLAQLTQQAQK